MSNPSPLQILPSHTAAGGIAPPAKLPGFWEQCGLGSLGRPRTPREGPSQPRGKAHANCLKLVRLVLSARRVYGEGTVDVSVRSCDGLFSGRTMRIRSRRNNAFLRAPGVRVRGRGNFDRCETCHGIRAVIAALVLTAVLVACGSSTSSVPNFRSVPSAPQGTAW